MSIVIGTAGWSIAAEARAHFVDEGSALERYAGRFGGVEINSSFHRPHRASTWRRWAESVPEGFRFSVKLPKTITHQRGLVDCKELLDAFLEEAGELGEKLSVLLVQLPPKLGFNAGIAEDFFDYLRAATPARIACEPRHPDWFEVDADALLAGLKVARVAADPARVPEAAFPGGWRGLAYWRLHGSPIMYRSSYEAEQLEDYAELLKREECEAWCMFDNTASSAAAGNALGLLERVADFRVPAP